MWTSHLYYQVDSSLSNKYSIIDIVDGFDIDRPCTLVSRMLSLSSTSTSKSESSLFCVIYLVAAMPVDDILRLDDVTVNATASSPWFFIVPSQSEALCNIPHAESSFLVVLPAAALRYVRQCGIHPATAVSLFNFSPEPRLFPPPLNDNGTAAMSVAGIVFFSMNRLISPPLLIVYLRFDDRDNISKAWYISGFSGRHGWACQICHEPLQQLSSFLSVLSV